MNNFELIENYLVNRLGEQEKAAFEKQMASDPSLKADVDLQKGIIEGVRKARVLELKAMLSQVPVGTPTGSVISVKIAASIIAAGVVTTALYFYMKPSTVKITPIVKVEKAPEKLPVVIEKEKVSEPSANPKSTVEPKAEKSKVKPEKKSEASEPISAPHKIEVVDPSKDLVDNTTPSPASGDGQKSKTAVSHIAVETDASNKKYNFHYHFFNNHLALYGSFDKSLYEILEINGDRKTVFLFYKGSYYLLDEKQNDITPLVPIKDASLIRKLKEYRGQ